MRTSSTITSVEPQGESQAGEGASQDADYRPEDNATDDDAKNAGGNVTGKVKGKTLDMAGVPAKAMSPTSPAAGHARTTATPMPPTRTSRRAASSTTPCPGPARRRQDAQTLKSDPGVMQAIQALAKSVKDSNAAVTKSVTDLARRVDQVSALAKKTDAALNGTVFNEVDGDRAPARKAIEASDHPASRHGLFASARVRAARAEESNPDRCR